MRLRLPPVSDDQLKRLAGCLLLAAVCCVAVRFKTLGLGETKDASLWACVTTAAMSLVYFRPSQ